MLSVKNERGDTLVEVLMAFTLLSLIAVAAFGVMNRGIGEAQNSLERSQVRSFATQQVEYATYLRDQYMLAIANGGSAASYPANLWTQIKARANANASTIPTNLGQCTPVMNNSFYLFRNTATGLLEVRNFTDADMTTTTYARPGLAMWIEPIASTSTGNPSYQKYVDLYVKACWNPAAGSVGQRLSTVVRLYDK